MKHVVLIFGTAGWQLISRGLKPLFRALRISHGSLGLAVQARLVATGGSA